ncbi:MAG: cupredoxin domain-containing protein [Acidimicrobiales bacterium]
MSRGPALRVLGASAASLVAALLLSACGGGSNAAGPGASSPASTPAGTASASVSIVDDPTNIGAFKPATVSVTLGGEVHWTNDSNAPHNVTFDDASISSSQTFNKGADFRSTFIKAGTFAYKCTIHPGMHGKVIVG